MIKHHRTRGWVRIAAVTVFCGFLTGCVSENNGAAGIFGPSQGSGAPIFGLERGSRFGTALTGNDRESIANAAGDLLASSQPDAARSWSAGGDSGQIRLGGTILVGLDANSGAPIPAPSGIDTSLALSPASGNYTAVRNVNIRLGPSQTAMVSQTLNEGTTVRAYGYDKTGNWYLVGGSESILGYVSGELLKAQGGGEPVLAGGLPKRPRLCRELELSLTTADARSDSWTAIVCRGANGWEAPAERGLS